jgi:hypothetical protein
MISVAGAQVPVEYRCDHGDAAIKRCVRYDGGRGRALDDAHGLVRRDLRYTTVLINADDAVCPTTSS